MGVRPQDEQRIGGGAHCFWIYCHWANPSEPRPPSLCLVNVTSLGLKQVFTLLENIPADCYEYACRSLGGFLSISDNRQANGVWGPI